MVMRITGMGGRTDQFMQGDAFWFHNPNNVVTNNIATNINSGVNDNYGYGYRGGGGGHDQRPSVGPIRNCYRWSRCAIERNHPAMDHWYGMQFAPISDQNEKTESALY